MTYILKIKWKNKQLSLECISITSSNLELNQENWVNKCLDLND